MIHPKQDIPGVSMWIFSLRKDALYNLVERTATAHRADHGDTKVTAQVKQRDTPHIL